MFAWSAATRISLVLGATDLRQGFDGLYALVQKQLELDPLSGHVFLFANRRRSRVKLLFWYGGLSRPVGAGWIWPPHGAGFGSGAPFERVREARTPRRNRGKTCPSVLKIKHFMPPFFYRAHAPPAPDPTDSPQVAELKRPLRLAPTCRGWHT
jgi:hypothetical protein